MRNVALLLLLLLALPAFGSISLIQHPANTSCGTTVTTCAVTVTTLGTNHLVVAAVQFKDTTTTISSISGGGSWTHCADCHQIDTSAVVGTDASYLPVATSADTTVTVTFSASCTGAQVEIVEYSYSDQIALDITGRRDQTSAVTNPAGVTLALTGSSDVIVQFISSGGTVSAISGSYTNPADFSTNAGTAGVINTSSGTAPTWTTTSARAALCALAFKEVSTITVPLATMEQVPTLIQANSLNTSSESFAYNVTVNHTLMVAWLASNSASPTIADTLGTSYAEISCSISASSEFGHIFLGTAPYSGPDTVTVTGTGGQSIRVMEWANLSTTVDTCATANNNANSSSIANVPSITTAKYRDLIVDFEDSPNNTAEIMPAAGSAYSPLVGSTTGRMWAGQYRIAGEPGTESGVQVTENVGASATMSELAVAIEASTSLTVSTEAIPDAIQTQSYNFQMGAKGGDGTNTWTTTSGSLPAGLSLSSGGNINGTCTNSNPNSITFQVSDTNSHTATKSLTVKCASSANTIAHSQTANGGASPSFGSNVTVGNLILLGLSYVNTFTPPVCTDNRGTAYSALPGVGMSLPSTGTTLHWLWQWGFVGNSGAWTLTCSVGASGVVADEFSHVQQIFDSSVLSLSQQNGGTSSQTITSGSITAPVSETLYAIAGMGTAAGTIAADSPFTSSATNTQGSRRWNAMYDIGAASGSQTASWDLTGNTSGVYSMLLFGLRPDTSGLAPLGGVRHRSSVY